MVERTERTNKHECMSSCGIIEQQMYCFYSSFLSFRPLLLGLDVDFDFDLTWFLLHNLRQKWLYFVHAELTLRRAALSVMWLGLTP